MKKGIIRRCFSLVVMGVWIALLILWAGVGCATNPYTQR
jgi:hypothetical protein